MGQIWDDPWIIVATQRGDGIWNTTLPPPTPPALPEGATFQCTQALRDPQAWADFVRTGWGPSVLVSRLEGAWIPVILDSSGELLATCVLRPRGGVERLWLLETLRARRGFGSFLMRHVFAWLGAAGPFVLGFTWELTVAELVGAYLRGWLRAAAAIEYGWIWRRERADGCSFCPGEGVDPHRRPVFELPTLLRFGSSWAIVSDSGLHDGMGNVQAWEGLVPWESVAEAGGWVSLWTRAATAPAPKWLRTGEIVVVGLVNSGSGRADRWITAEI
jgi:hypothetical protein